MTSQGLRASREGIRVNLPKLFTKISLLLAVELLLKNAVDPKLKQVLQKLKKQLPKIDSNPEKFRDWWQAKGKVWGEQLRDMLIKYRNIGYNWQLNEQQKELLQQYYDVNKLLIGFLNSATCVTPIVRQDIEETLLLAIADIENLRNSCINT